MMTRTETSQENGRIKYYRNESHKYNPMISCVIDPTKFLSQSLDFYVKLNNMNHKVGLTQTNRITEWSIKGRKIGTRF